MGVMSTQAVEAFDHLYFFQEIFWGLENAVCKNTAFIPEPISLSCVKLLRSKPY